MLIEAAAHNFLDDVIGHELALTHLARDARGKLGVRLDVPAKDIPDRNVDQTVGRLEIWACVPLPQPWRP
jgi:hypothetical protein